MYWHGGGYSFKPIAYRYVELEGPHGNFVAFLTIVFVFVIASQAGNPVPTLFANIRVGHFDMP